MNDTNTDASLLSDREIARIASEDALRRGALAERDRRAEVKREEEARAAAAKAERARLASVKEQLDERGRWERVAKSTQHDMGKFILKVADALSERTTALYAIERVDEELRRLGAPHPSNPIPEFDAAVRVAGERLAPVLEREFSRDPRRHLDPRGIPG